MPNKTSSVSSKRLHSTYYQSRAHCANIEMQKNKRLSLHFNSPNSCLLLIIYAKCLQFIITQYNDCCGVMWCDVVMPGNCCGIPGFLLKSVWKYVFVSLNWCLCVHRYLWVSLCCSSLSSHQIIAHLYYSSIIFTFYFISILFLSTEIMSSGDCLM